MSTAVSSVIRIVTTIARRMMIPAAIMLAACICLPARASVEVRRDTRRILVISGSLQIECNLESGRSNYRWRTGASILDAECRARLADGTEISSAGATRHDCLSDDVARIKDKFGNGVQFVVRHRSEGLPELQQQFRVYEASTFCTVELDVVNKNRISTNYIAPLLCDADHTPHAGAFLGSMRKPRTLFVPFDNDAYARYNSDYATSSHEVTAIYDDISRHGFVLGSLSHGIWKTGIAMGINPVPRSNLLYVGCLVRGRKSSSSVAHRP